MKTRSLFFLSLAVAIAVSPTMRAESIQDPIEVDGGKIAGATTETKGVRVYKGIPFAAPPIGQLRWKPPRRVPAWPGVRACVEFGPACPQPTVRLLTAPGAQDEDCLFLNVWTAARDNQERRPVMVWIHGGGSTIGSASQPFYDGQRFAASGVVLVSINYRLGPFGFLAHPELSAESPHEVSGNYGTLDQIAALQWVQRNIHRFGGDADNVTIFGESAGGVSCGVLLTSPLASGLFHRAILQSGVPAAIRTPLRDGDNSAEAGGRELFENLGVENLAAARRTSPAEILNAQRVRVGILDQGVKYGPIVDGWVTPEPPMKRLIAGRFHQVPILAGSNADEATLFSGRVPIRREFGYRMLVKSVFKREANAVLDVFPPDYAATPKESLDKLITVMSFVSPTRMLVRSVQPHQSDTYLYHFTRVAPLVARTGKGATHGAEIPYVFRYPSRLLSDPVDQSLSETMHRCWIQFARTGNPNTSGLPKWPRYDAEQDQHLEFGDTTDSGSGLYRSECDFFEQQVRRELGL